MGRPGPNTRYKDVTGTRYTLTPVTDTALTARDAATAAGLPPLPLYHENRQAPAPSGAVILAELSDIAVTTVTASGRATLIPPDLTPVQQQLISLLDIPPGSYHQHQAHHDRQARKSA